MFKRFAVFIAVALAIWSSDLKPSQAGMVFNLIDIGGGWDRYPSSHRIPNCGRFLVEQVQRRYRHQFECGYGQSGWIDPGRCRFGIGGNELLKLQDLRSGGCYDV